MTRSALLRRPASSSSRGMPSPGMSLPRAQPLEGLCPPTREAHAAERCCRTALRAKQPAPLRGIPGAQQAAAPPACAPTGGAAPSPREAAARPGGQQRGRPGAAFSPTLGHLGLRFGSCQTAQRTLQGDEAMHMSRQGQLQGVPKALTTSWVLISSKGSREAQSDQSRTDSTLRQRPLCLCSPPPRGLCAALLDGMQGRPSGVGVVGNGGPWDQTPTARVARVQGPCTAAGVGPVAALAGARAQRGGCGSAAGGAHPPAVSGLSS
jgi:hypothetical protein